MTTQCSSTTYVFNEAQGFGLNVATKPTHQVSNISGTLAGYKIVAHSDVVGASPVGAAPTTSSFSS